MTELSAAAGIVGLIMAAAHTTRRLSNDIRNIVDAPTTVQDLNAEVGLLESSITSLEAIKEQHWESLDKGIAQRSEVAIKTCKSSCESQLEELREWTKRSAGGKRSWRESVNIGFFKTKEIKAMAGQLQKCKSSLDLVVNIVTLYTANSTSSTVDAIKAQLKSQQSSLSALAVSANHQVAQLEDSLAALSLTSSPLEESTDEAEEDGDRESAQAALEQELAIARALQDLVEELKIKLEPKNFQQHNQQVRNDNISVRFGANNSGQQIGINNGSTTNNFGGPRYSL